MKLTVKNTAGLKLPPGKTDHIEFDNGIPGFGLRLRDGGSKTWIYQYSLGTKQRRLVIGKATALTPDKARELAADLHAKVRLGADPAAERAMNKAQAANSFGELARRYLEFQESNLRPRSLVEVTRHLESYAKAFHGLPVGSIDRRTIADRLGVIAKDSGAVTANRVRASLSALFGWAMREGLAPSNPVINTNKREEKSRERVLSDSELRTVWLALDQDDYGAIIKLLMFTGQRANEIAGLRWSEIFDDQIVLPAARTKNGRVHIVPLADPARIILDALPRRTTSDGEPRDLVFGRGDGPFSGWSKSKERLEERILELIKADAGRAGLPHWVPHDLRRTVATRMAEDLKVVPHVIEAVLNHVSGHKGGIAGVYNRATYLAEKKQALAIWAEHLLAVVEGRNSNVTPLRRA
jgi:integrase